MFTRITGMLTRHSRLIILAVTGAAGVLATAGSLSYGVDSGVEHLRERVMAKRASGSTVVIAIDARSIQEIQAWPWPRSTHGRLVERLNRAGARNIVFDLSFTTSATDPKQDRMFAQSLARSPGNVSLLALNDLRDGSKADALPIAQLRGNTTPASGWITIDKNQELLLPREQVISGLRVGTLSSRLAGRQAPAGMDQFKPDWAIRHDSIPTLSYVDVLRGGVDDGQLRGKDVIIGATAQAFGDQWIAGDGQRVAGVYIHAMAAETLKRGVARPTGPYAPLAAMIFIVALGLMIRNRLIGSAVMIAGYAGLIAALWLIQERFGYAGEVGPAAMALVMAVAIQIGASVASVVRRKITTNTTTNLPNLAGMRIDEPEGSNTVAVRLNNQLETFDVLGLEQGVQLMRSVRDRIRVVAGDAQIYQVDEHSFAWRTNLEGVQLSDTIEGLSALFGAGVMIEGRVIDTPISAGIAERHEGTLEESVTAALLAAEHAARQGIPWTRHVDADADAEWRLTMMGEFNKALEKGHVWVAYQSKWDAQDTSRCLGAEALVRWSHPERGPIRPDQFIPLLEEGGRIDGLTACVLDTAIRDFAPFDSMSVAVNLSTRLLGRGKIVETVRNALAKHGMPAGQLTLEITESASLDGKASISELEELAAMGVKISIDDYGTGQSTLTYVRKLPAKELKIDQSFVRAMLTSRSDQLMISSTIELSHQLGLDVVAEGVETQGEADALRELGCDILQGYHLGRPVSLDDFMARHVADLVKTKRKRA